MLLFLLLTIEMSPAFSQENQTAIPRIEMMPNEPDPYNVRDWKAVARDYDAFVYDLGAAGQYLPLVFLNDSGINYPENESFGLRTYVGTNSPTNGEAINVLPSLVSASLVGIDKSNQFGRNWILMSQDYFNRANGEGIYLNNRGGSSGNDWWYDMMPNVFFYQLYDLYPPIGDAEFQFTSIADRFAEAVRAMGGSDTPWSKAGMNYRAWDFVDMQPNAEGVIEPEAAGAFAWVLYHAYQKTGNREYLKAAEWSMEFLNQLTANPSYELQLPYGTYAAARMNAEIGTAYDVEKMLNWSFDRGALRGWGTIVGTWGSFDVSGLVGEANDNGNDYAFLLNGLQQAGALAPLVRYDKRFARAIGKWILNLANASRLFFPGFLPPAYQDGSEWANANDPQRVIAQESMRETANGLSPFVTGDALNGGWANTNLSLYSSSSIGYLGAIVEKTNVDKILKIDLLKTDFFGNEAYPTYLLFNPYSLEKTVTIDVGETPVDVYEALSEIFSQANVSQSVNIAIPPDEAIVVVLTPAGGQMTVDRNKRLINGIVVDYQQSGQPITYAPRIQALAILSQEVEIGTTVTLFGKAFDRDSENLTYTWTANGGIISGSDSTVLWQAPGNEGDFEVILTVSDEQQQSDTDTLLFHVVPEINVAPQIIEIVKDRDYLSPGDTLSLFAYATDANADVITYSWSAAAGTLVGEGAAVAWISPNTEGIFTLSLVVQDDEAAASQQSVRILVKAFDAAGTGNLIAYYPFHQNADDVSGNELHGQANGPALTTGVDGVPFDAYFFDGVNDHIRVTNDPLLNFTEAVTVSCWAKADLLPDREVFILSHGSWQNRWKVSVTPEQKIRWTVNSSAGPIGDLDAELKIEADTFYHLAATYDGELMVLYINGVLHSYRPLNGPIRSSPVDLLIGQMLPDDQAYNFRGVIDEVKIYDYALIPDEIATLYQEGLVTATNDKKDQPENKLVIIPNPVRGQMTVRYSFPESGEVTVFIYNQLGQLVLEKKVGWLPSERNATLLLTLPDLPPGIYYLGMRSRSAFPITTFTKF